MSKSGNVTRALAAGIALGFAGCTTIPPAYVSMSQSELRANDKLKRDRANVLKISLEERLQKLEEVIETNLFSLGKGLLLPLYKKGDEFGPLYLDNNALLLSALSAKYKVTLDEKTKNLADSIILGIRELDKLNEVEGYIPLSVNPKSLDLTKQATNANAYTQLFFAYIHYTKKVGESHEIKGHVSEIYQRFLDDNFHLLNEKGERIRDADLNRNLLEFNPSRTLDRRVLDTTAFYLGDEKTKELVSKNRWQGISVSPLRINIGFWEIPTISSSWLNMLKLNILNECGLNYNGEIIRLGKSYTDMDNPFFQILMNMADNSIDLSHLEERLSEFPYPITDKKVVNSHRRDIKFRVRKFRKTKSKKEVVNPLPLYELSSDYYLWKRNLLEADKHGANQGRVYFGVDFLQAYWFLKSQKIQTEVFKYP